MDNCVDLRNISDVVLFWSDLSVAGHQLGPLLPLRTLVSVVEGRLVGRPAALLVAVPEGRQTHAFLQVCHPVHRQVDHSGQRTCREQDTSAHLLPLKNNVFQIQMEKVLYCLLGHIKKL